MNRPRRRLPRPTSRPGLTPRPAGGRRHLDESVAHPAERPGRVAPDSTTRGRPATAAHGSAPRARPPARSASARARRSDRRRAGRRRRSRRPRRARWCSAAATLSLNAATARASPATASASAARKRAPTGPNIDAVAGSGSDDSVAATAARSAAWAELAEPRASDGIGVGEHAVTTAAAAFRFPSA